MSISVLFYGETIFERYMCSNLQSRVPNTNAFHALYVFIVMLLRYFVKVKSKEAFMDPHIFSTKIW